MFVFTDKWGTNAEMPLDDFRIPDWVTEKATVTSPCMEDFTRRAARSILSHCNCIRVEQTCDQLLPGIKTTRQSAVEFWS